MNVCLFTMIYIITKIINSLALTLRTAFLVISFIGQVIVTVTSTIVSAILGVLTSIVYFVQIIYEDNSFLLTEELPSLATSALTGFVEQWNYLHSSLSASSNYVYQRINNAIAIVTSTTDAVTTVVIELVLLLKRSVIFCGDTLWFIITFIPVQLPLLLRTVFACIRDIVVASIVDAYMVLLRLTNFLTDVPLESCVGITSAIIIVRLCIHFKENIKSQLIMLYWLVVRKVMYMYHSAYNYFTDSEVRVIANMARGQEMDRAEGNVVDAVDDPADALCVICQERQKCVLILPCRHVCLCRDCCLRLYGYQRTCPICRTFIYHSVNIYL